MSFAEFTQALATFRSEYLPSPFMIFVFITNYHLKITPVIFIAGRPKAAFCFGSLVILDVARCYLWLYTLYINIKKVKIVVKC